MLVPADVEQALVDTLAPFYPIATRIPQTLPDLFLRVVASGGFQRDLVSDNFTVTLEAFGLRESLAQQALSYSMGRLADAVEKIGYLGSEVCYEVSGASAPSNYPNPDVPTHTRYVVTLTVVLRRRLIP